MRLLYVAIVISSVLCQGNAAVFTSNERGMTTCQVTQSGCNYVVTMKQHNGCEQMTNGNQSQVANDITGTDDVVIQRLNYMQERLARMIKELSVRTLRHIRQIKTSIHKVRT